MDLTEAGYLFDDKWPAAAVAEAFEAIAESPASQPVYGTAFFDQYLREARAILEQVDAARLIDLPARARRNLATASLLFWQQRVGTTAAELETDIARRHENMATRIAHYIALHGDTSLIEDLDLAAKAQASLVRSPCYESLLQESADQIAAYAAMALTGGIKDEQLFYTDIVEIQSKVWQDALPDICKDLPPFTVITEPRNLDQDRFLILPDGGQAVYLGPDSDGTPHWLAGNHRELSWLISHERLHSIQWHLDELREADLLPEPLLEDMQNASFNDEFDTPDFPADIFGRKNADHRSPLELAAYRALYLSHPLEAAAFQLHNTIIAGIDARLSPGPRSPRPPVRSTRSGYSPAIL